MNVILQIRPSTTIFCLQISVCRFLAGKKFNTDEDVIDVETEVFFNDKDKS